MEGTDHKLCAMDRSGTTGADLSVCRRHEVDSARRGDDTAITAARPVSALHRRMRGSRRNRPDPARASRHSSGPDTVGHRRALHRHGWRDGGHPGCRRCRAGAAPAGGRDSGSFRRPRPLAAGPTALTKVPVMSIAATVVFPLCVDGGY